MADGDFSTTTRTHTKWECACIECSNQAKFKDAPDRGKWNNAQKMACGICGVPPTGKCVLCGSGLGKRAGKWKPWNDPKHPRHASSPDGDPSTRTPAAKQSQAKAAEKAARHKLAESEKARKAAEKEIKELRAAAAGDSSDLTTDADDQG